MGEASANRRLDVETITRAAAGLADREGLDAVSMRRVAAELGVAAMSLYGHVPSKDELVERIADAALADVPPIDTQAPWDAAVAGFFEGLHAMLMRRPAVADAMARRPTSGPLTRRHGEAVLDVLGRAGFPDRLAVDAFVALSCYTLGSAVYAAARAGARTRDGEWVGLGGPPAGRVAALGSHLAGRAGHDRFASGLRHLVAGYAAELPR